jgi:sulfoxide reductase heme-binding subunit YedZ
MTASNPVQRKWWERHVLVIFLTTVLMIFFLYSRAEWSAMHRWNRAFGDVSLILVAIAMALGPLSRLRRKTVRSLPYRRELGIYAIVLATIHTIIILVGWVNLDLMRLIGFELHPELQRYVMFDQGFGLANLIGVLALLYGLILAITSNDRSMRVLGSTVWKFVQQGTHQ